jgi:hypothetical protein
MKGYENLPSFVKEPFVSYLDKNFSHTRFSVNSASEKCLELALENIKANGGSVEGDEVIITVQSFISDEPVEIAFPTLTASDAFWITDSRIRWHGSWSMPKGGKRGLVADGFRYSGQAGDYMEVEFPGTAVYVAGHLKFDHGILEVFIDGKSLGTRDLYQLKKWPWGSGQASAVWITGLLDGTHILRIEVTGQKNEESEGTLI